MNTRRGKTLRPGDVTYQKHLLCVRHSAQSLGFTVDRTVEVTVLTELTINTGTKE